MSAEEDVKGSGRASVAAANAKVKAARAAELHGQGKHAEAVEAAKEGLKALGM